MGYSSILKQRNFWQLEPWELRDELFNLLCECSLRKGSALNSVLNWYSPFDLSDICDLSITNDEFLLEILQVCQPPQSCCTDFDEVCEYKQRARARTEDPGFYLKLKRKTQHDGLMTQPSHLNCVTDIGVCNQTSGILFTQRRMCNRSRPGSLKRVPRMYNLASCSISVDEGANASHQDSDDQDEDASSVASSQSDNSVPALEGWAAWKERFSVSNVAMFANGLVHMFDSVH